MKNICLLFMSCLLLVACSKEKKVSLRVTNDSPIDRVSELVEVSWSELSPKLQPGDIARLVVLDEQGNQLPRQFVFGNPKELRSVLFPATVPAGKAVVYTITTGKAESFPTGVYGRLVSERKDDFAWESSKAAFRMYGPALQATGEISNGIDFWVKSTDSLIIDRWYKNDLSGKASYHKDHGEGLDFYKVGRTLGLGALAPFVNDTLWLGENFVKQEVIENGPLRFTFRLTYAPFEVNGKQVTESRTISLDANSRMNKIVEQFDMEDASMPVASGIILRPEGGEMNFSATEGYAAYAEPSTTDGVIYAGVVSPTSFAEIKESCGHLLSVNKYTKGTDYTYYTGGGWSKGGFDSATDWFGYVSDFATRIRQPLTVIIVE